ncbi:hypothetical protein E4P42_00410 [Mycobacterium sp. PS03-16]|uniref:hypothetical protein n=1 Tax=Mycobacterium sp. PS03-16 TaxID=2559611 RepID=UPI001073C48B|nr:hypothetical protein [Mycobacterium sp. PS03-16]TFV61399.1 hypothetical protein E4P42_00410 [Mycobacterium sp. PS03-16]
MSVETTSAAALVSVTDDQADTRPRQRQARTTKQAAEPRALTLICERCERPVRGVGAGFAYVDLRDAQAVAMGHRPPGAEDGGKAGWSVAHKACAPEATATINPYFRMWAERVSTTDDLLDAVADLSRLSWFGHTDWGGLVRRLLADTEHDRTEGPAQRARQAAERRAGQLAADDPRHGTVNGYNNYGCRCEECRLAFSDAHARKKAAKAALSAAHSDDHGSGGVDGH